MNDIFLSEVSFKDKSSDWIEILVNSPIKTPLVIKDDGKIAEIPQTSNINYILIHFKSEKKPHIENNVLHIYTPKSGLTGTTEQITLESDEEIIDSVCWKNSTPTESELDDIKELNLVGKCINSEDISANQSIAKTTNGWEIHKHPTPAAENIYYNSPPTAKITIQKGKTEDEVPFSINLDSSSTDPDEDPLTYKWTFPDKIIEKENPASYKLKISGTYSISLTVTDPEGLSSTDSLQITAKNSTEDLKSAELLEQITSSQTPYIPIHTKEQLPHFIVPLIIFAALLTLIIQNLTLRHHHHRRPSRHHH
jgi:PKD repeat protein